MYTKHFLRMFIRLIGMALLGVGALLLINYYHKSNTGVSPSPVSSESQLPTPSTTSTTTTTTTTKINP